MTRDPVRWLESHESSELLLLMRVGAEELAPPEALARVAERIRAPELASRESSPPPRAQPESGPALRWWSGAGSKALGLSLLLGAAGLSLYALVRPTTPAPAPAHGSAHEEQASTALPASQRTLPPSAHSQDTAPAPVASLDGAREEVEREQAEPVAPLRRPQARRRAQPSAPSAPPVDARLAEARLLEQARRELSARPDHALALLREHAAQFPQSWLEEERAAMMIRALVQTGQSAAAHLQLARFKTRFPHSVHTPRLEHTLAPR